MCWDDILEEGDLKCLLIGRLIKLEFQFCFIYSMIFNLFCVEDFKVSFFVDFWFDLEFVICWGLFDLD